MITYTLTETTNDRNRLMLSSSNLSEIYSTAMMYVGKKPHDFPKLSDIQRAFLNKVNASYTLSGDGITVTITKAYV